MKIIALFIISLGFLSGISANIANLIPPCHETNLHWFPHPLDCSRYFLCHHGEAVERSCAPQLNFNNSTGQCMPQALSPCSLACPFRDDPSNPIFLPNPQDCSRFFLCYNGVAHPWQCASGLFFDSVENWCNFESLVECGDRGGSGQTTAGPDDIETTTREAETTTEAVETTTREVTTRNPDLMDCPLELGPFYFPHTVHCHRYFRCYMGIARLLTCPGYSNFDHIQGVCKLEANCFPSAK